jgi:hypothetical protein
MEHKLSECMDMGILLRRQVGTERGQPVYVYALNLEPALEMGMVDPVAERSVSRPAPGRLRTASSLLLQPWHDKRIERVKMAAVRHQRVGDRLTGHQEGDRGTLLLLGALAVQPDPIALGSLWLVARIDRARGYVFAVCCHLRLPSCAIAPPGLGVWRSLKSDNGAQHRPKINRRLVKTRTVTSILPPMWGADK